MDTEFGAPRPGTSIHLQVSSHEAATSLCQHFANGKVAISDDSPIFPPLE
jgi:hypothetical protein